MKNFWKIFLITLSIQLLGFSLSYHLGKLSNTIDTRIKALAIVYVVSFIVAVVLGIQSGQDLKQRILYIVFMPTNYFWLIGIFVMYYIIVFILSIFSDIPDNFGMAFLLFNL